MDKKVIFVHGYTASSQADWNPNISKALRKLGVDHFIPDLPGREYPHSKDWLEIIDREVKATEKPIVLVGYSLGTRTALLYLDIYEPNNIDTVILVAAFNNDWEHNRERKDEHYADFFEYAVDIEKLKKLAKQFIVIHSKDDSSIDYQQGAEIANELGAKLITHDGLDHMSAPENYTYVLEALKTVL